MGRKIRTVRPNDRPAEVIQLSLRKVALIAKRLEDGACKEGRGIYDALSAIIEGKPQQVRAAHFSASDS